MCFMRVKSFKVFLRDIELRADRVKGKAHKAHYVKRSYVADLETGARNPSVRTLVKLANALRVKLKDLVEDGE